MTDLSIETYQGMVDEWIRTFGVRCFSELTNLARIHLPDALRRNLDKKTRRDASRHRKNPKLQA